MSIDLTQRFFSKKETSLTYGIIECIDGALRIARVLVDESAHQVRFSHIRSLPHPLDLEGLWQKIYGSLTRYEQRIPLVIAVDAHLARTTHTTAAIIRKDIKQQITEAELEDAIAHSLWKAFNRDRDYIAEQFHIPDIDIELADARVIGVRLDGHKVMSPIGFSARTIEFELVLTYMPQFLAQEFRSVFAETDIMLVEEAGVLWAEVVRSSQVNDFLLTPLFKSQTLLVERNGASIRLTDTMRWGRDNIIRVIENECGVDKPLAEKIISLFYEEKIGGGLRRKLITLIAEEMKTVLLSAQNHRQSATHLRLYLMPGIDLPDAVYKAAFSKQRSKTIPVTVLGKDFLGEKTGYKVHLEEVIDSSIYSSLCMSAGALLLDAPDERLSKLAKRRVRWMHTNT